MFVSSYIIKMRKRTIRRLLPSLREKKRYVAFEILSTSAISADQARQTLKEATQKYLGYKGLAQAGMSFLSDTYHNNTGIVRVAQGSVDDISAAMVYATEAAGKPCIIRSRGASGVLKTTREKYIKN